MKTTADALRDVGRTITESELVLNLLRGLNPRFAGTADNIADSHPLSDFATTREKLVLKELRLANEGTVAAQTAFHAACGPACRSTSGNAGSGSSAGRQGGHGGGGGYGGSGGGGGGSRYRKKGWGGHGGFQSGGGPWAPTPPAGPWYCYAPWTGGPQQQQWHPPAANPAWRGPDVLGAYPQAHTAFAPAQLSDSPTVYCEQPSGFIDPAAPDFVCLLQKSLYGLK